MSQLSTALCDLFLSERNKNKLILILQLYVGLCLHQLRDDKKSVFKLPIFILVLSIQQTIKNITGKFQLNKTSTKISKFPYIINFLLPDTVMTFCPFCKTCRNNSLHGNVPRYLNASASEFSITTDLRLINRMWLIVAVNNSRYATSYVVFY